jgi:hypothetical protein
MQFLHAFTIGYAEHYILALCFIQIAAKIRNATPPFQGPTAVAQMPINRPPSLQHLSMRLLLAAHVATELRTL